MLRTQIQFEPDEYERLRKEADRRGCSISAVVRESVRATLDNQVQTSGRELAASLVGKYRSGLSDLATNHDEYLDGGW